LSALSKRLTERLLKLPDTSLNGGNVIDGIINVTFKGISAEAMLLYLDGKGICASTGAACNASDRSPSRVLKALGISDEDALSSIRFSLSHENTEEEIGFIATVIEEFYKNR
jgi:cysteine desulfurase